jgi:hypothetical protein
MGLHLLQGAHTALSAVIQADGAVGRPDENRIALPHVQEVDL